MFAWHRLFKTCLFDHQRLAQDISLANVSLLNNHRAEDYFENGHSIIIKLAQ